MKKSILVLLLLSLFPAAGFGTELEQSHFRDPFDFAGRDVDSDASMRRPSSRLGMVADVGGNLVAYIDGVPHKVGDVIDGARITVITLKHVELFSPTKRWRMYVDPNKEQE